MNFGLYIILFALTFGCVKEDAKISNANSSGGSTGSTSGGTGGSGPTVADPLAMYAWHLNNTGQNSFSNSSGTNGEDISVEAVHTLFNIKGRNVKIAVSDTGVDVEHKDLAANALPDEHRNYSFATYVQWRGGIPTPLGDQPHGTGVAGLIAALGWNGIGSRGVAPEAKFAAFMYIFTPQAGTTAASLLAKEIDQLYGDFDIFNYSYGYTGYVFVQEEDAVKEAVQLGITQLRSGKGAIYVQSAGNSYYEKFLFFCADPLDPLCYDETSGNTNAHETLTTPHKIVVGAVDARGKITSYSTPGSGLWVSAPGGEDGYSKPAMITTDLSGCKLGGSYRNMNLSQYFNFGYNSLNTSCDYVNTFNGTSSAAPVVTGVVALMLEANPTLTWRDVKHILAQTSDRVDYNALMNELDHPLNNDLPGYQYDYKWVRNAAGIYYSNLYGFGRVNAEQAVSMAMTYNSSTLGTYQQTSDSDGNWYYQSGPLAGVTIPDASPVGAENKLWVGHNYLVESVQIVFNSSHPWPGELAIHLVSPSGTESRLLNINSNIHGAGVAAHTQMISNAFYGEPSEGYWTIKLYDGNNQLGSGDLTNWKILINGHLNPFEIYNPMPPTFINYGPVPVSSSQSPIFSFIHSTDSATLDYYEAAVGTAANNESVKDWTNIGLNHSGQQLNGMSLVNGQTYYLKIRAVSPSGVSSVQVIPWTAGF
jgi:subtilisin family serine protease